jgi:hypothetical protein
MVTIIGLERRLRKVHGQIEIFTTRTQRNALTRQMELPLCDLGGSKTWQRFSHHMSEAVACTSRGIPGWNRHYLGRRMTRLTPLKERLIQTLIAGTA